MKITAKEPEFSIATIRLGNEIHAQLVRASRKARDSWSNMFSQNCERIPEILKQIAQSQRTINLPVVNSFMWTWAQQLEWNIYRPDCTDAIGVQVPDKLIAALQTHGTIESFEFLLVDLAKPVCASHGNNDHDFKFGLFINCPIWIGLASLSEHVHSFEKQLGVVVHHEMAHFRHQQENLRSEFHAHCRSVAWALSKDDFPKTTEATVKLLQQQHPDVWYHNEIKLLFTERGRSAFRLIRLWHRRFRASPFAI